MRRSSIFILGAVAFLIAFAAMVAIPLSRQSMPEITQKDAEQILEGLGNAFEKESVGGVTSYAAEDADIAGRRLEQIRQLLQAAFRNMKDPQVRWSEFNFTRERGNRATIHATVNVADAAPGADPQTTFGPARVEFVLERRTYPQMLGLMQVHKWKITQAAIPNLPDIPGGIMPF
jgi:hypothetical protein